MSLRVRISPPLPLMEEHEITKEVILDWFDSNRLYDLHRRSRFVPEDELIRLALFETPKKAEKNLDSEGY